MTDDRIIRLSANEHNLIVVDTSKDWREACDQLMSLSREEGFYLESKYHVLPTTYRDSVDALYEAAETVVGGDTVIVGERVLLMMLYEGHDVEALLTGISQRNALVIAADSTIGMTLTVAGDKNINNVKHLKSQLHEVVNNNNICNYDIASFDNDAMLNTVMEAENKAFGTATAL